jgi:predicted small metal-binding protein
MRPPRAAQNAKGLLTMKSFACGDVVPGCSAKWLCSTEDEILAEVAMHARQEHGMAEVPAEVLDQVRSKILIVV